MAGLKVGEYLNFSKRYCTQDTVYSNEFQPILNASAMHGAEILFAPLLGA